MRPWRGSTRLWAPPNEEMQLTSPNGLLAGGRGDCVRGRRTIVFESGFAGDPRCCADIGAGCAL